MSNWKDKDDYPRDRWGSYYRNQDMVSSNIYQKHMRGNHTIKCMVKSSEFCGFICKYIGEPIISDMEMCNMNINKKTPYQILRFLAGG